MAMTSKEGNLPSTPKQANRHTCQHATIIADPSGGTDAGATTPSSDVAGDMDDRRPWESTPHVKPEVMTGQHVTVVYLGHLC